jgi:class 3 adenylate cyclase
LFAPAKTLPCPLILKEDVIVNDRQFLEEAIAALQLHHTLLGDDVVETAVLTLREKLQTLSAKESSDSGESHHALAVLQADLSGFTALSAGMDPERVRDLVDALWRRFDSVIRNWGGIVDKYTGDGLIALFGLPQERDDDVERAILAALDMQLELALFNEANRRKPDSGPLNRQPLNRDFQMRIGVHAGPVIMTRVGASSEVTAIGETILLTEHLEKAAPVGGVLISYNAYRRAYGQFIVSRAESLPIPGRSSPLTVYVAQREKTRSLRQSGGENGRFLDRAAELERLQFALQETMDNSVTQLIVVTGAAGVGKSRLFAEFERWLDLLPMRGCLLNCQATQSDQQTPLALMRDLFCQLFDIHPRSSPAIRQEKFARGVQAISRAEPSAAREQAHVLGHWLGFDFADSPYLDDLGQDPARLAAYARSDLARFFTDLANNCPPLVWLVENCQWADAESLNLIDFLSAECPDLPLLIVCLARPSLLAGRATWQSSGQFSPISRINLLPLTPIDTRHLISHLLAATPQIPARLIDLMVHGAQGNPLYAEQMAGLLYDNGVIVAAGDGWRVNLSQLADTRPPDSLEALFQARFACLPPAEQTVLQLAAQVGERFGEGAVKEGITAVSPTLAPTIHETLDHLERRGLIFRQRASLPGTISEYQFCHDLLWQEVRQSAPTKISQPANWTNLGNGANLRLNQ